MRVALGATSAVEGGAHLFQRDGMTVAAAAAGILAVAGGVSLLLGCLTPLASILAASGGAAITFQGAPAALLLGGGPPPLLLLSVAAAVVLLGPGAFSLDARLFGLRKVIIPQAPRASQS